MITSSSSPSKAVIPASPTGHDVALATFVDEHWHNVEALFTFGRAALTSPSIMGAFVIVDQVEPRLLNKTLSNILEDLGGVVGSSHDLIRSVVKMLLVPVWTSASLPALTTDVTELGLTLASYYSVSVG